MTGVIGVGGWEKATASPRSSPAGGRRPIQNRLGALLARGMPREGPRRFMTFWLATGARSQYDSALALVGFDEVAATVLLPAFFVAFGAEGLFFAEADGAQAVGGDALRDEVLLDGAGATVAEAQVVFRGAAFVAMAFDGHSELRIVAQKFRGVRKSFAGVRANVGFIEIEIGVAHFLEEQGIGQVGTGAGIRRRRRGYGDARAGVGRAAGTGGGD